MIVPVLPQSVISPNPLTSTTAPDLKIATNHNFISGEHASSVAPIFKNKADISADDKLGARDRHTASPTNSALPQFLPGQSQHGDAR